jgi:hypothetical protein
MKYIGIGILVVTALACSDATPSDPSQPAEASTTAVDMPPGDPSDDIGSTMQEPAELKDLTVALPLPETGYQITTEPYVVPPGTEVDLCTVIRMEPNGDERFSWIKRMESLVSQGTHHMNIFIGQFSFLDGYLGEGSAEAALGVPLGQYPCDELSVMESAFPVFPSQRQNQQILMPPGVAIPMPVPLVLIASHHYINATQEPVKINAALNMEAVSGDTVDNVAGLVFDTAPTNIPAGLRKVEKATCIFERDVEMVLVSTHNHQWTECATLNHYDGQSQSIATEPFYVNKNWDQPPILNFEVGEYSMRAGDGVHFACHYNNYTDRLLVNDGTASGEMCVFAAVTYPIEATVSEVETVLNTGELSELIEFMDSALGPCDQIVLEHSSPWPDSAHAEAKSTCSSLTQTESN